MPTAFFQYRPLVEATAARYAYDPALLAAQAHRESAWSPRVVSPVGAQGLMQFMPGTWKDWGQGKDPFDPAASLDAGTRYMRNLMAQFRDVRLALAAYNWGAGNLNKAAKAAGSWAWEQIEPHLPEETRRYVPSILTLRKAYAVALNTATPVVLAVMASALGLLMLRRVAWNA